MAQPHATREEEQAITLPRFAAWIDATGARVIAGKLGVTRFTVWKWRRGAVNLALGRAVRHDGGAQPKADKLGDLVALARGALKASDIYPRKVKETPE